MIGPYKRFRVVDDVSFTLIPKCGLTSIMDSTPTGYDSWEPVGRLITFVRHPYDRLVSAYRFFKDYGDHVTDTWEAFVDYALSKFDPHWEPQVNYIREGSEAYKLAEIDKHWPLDTPVAWTNKSNPHPVSEYRRDDINDHYREDLLLWRGL